MHIMIFNKVLNLHALDKIQKAIYKIQRQYIKFVFASIKKL